MTARAHPSMPAGRPAQVIPIGHARSRFAGPAAMPVADPLRLDPEVEQLLRANAIRRRVRPGESLFLKGGAADALFGVVDGLLRVTAGASSGKEALISMIGPGHWFGEVALILGNARTYDVHAVLATELVLVPGHVFHELLAAHPAVQAALLRLVCLRMQRTFRWIDEHILLPLPERIAIKLLGLPRTTRRGEPDPAVEVRQEDLAAMLGVSRQAVNKQLKQWEAEGLLRLDYRRIRLLAIDRLKALRDGTATDSPSTHPRTALGACERNDE